MNSPFIALGLGITDRHCAMCFLCVNLDATCTLAVGREWREDTASTNEWTHFKTDLKEDGVIVDPDPNISGQWL